MTNCPTHASPYRSPPLPPPPPTFIPPHLSLCARYNYNYPLLRQWSNTTTASSTSSTPLRFSTRPPDYPGDQGFPSVGVRAICPSALVVPLLLIPLFSSTLSIVHGGAPRWGLLTCRCKISGGSAAPKNISHVKNFTKSEFHVNNFSGTRARSVHVSKKTISRTTAADATAASTVCLPPEVCP